MRDRILKHAWRSAALVLAVAVSLSVIAPAGSQEVNPPQLMRAPTQQLPFGGTVALYFTVESSTGEKLFATEVRCVRHSFSISNDTRMSDAEIHWRIDGSIQVLSEGEGQIIVDVRNLAFSQKAEADEMSFQVQASVLLDSGEEKTLFRMDDVTVRVRAVFEP